MVQPDPCPHRIAQADVLKTHRGCHEWPQGNQFKARPITQARGGGSCQRAEEKEVVRGGGILAVCLRKSLQKLMMDVRRSVRRREEFWDASRGFGLSHQRMGWPLTEAGKAVGGADWGGSRRGYGCCLTLCEMIALIPQRVMRCACLLRMLPQPCKEPRLTLTCWGVLRKRADVSGQLLQLMARGISVGIYTIQCQ